MREKEKKEGGGEENGEENGEREGERKRERKKEKKNKHRENKAKSVCGISAIARCHKYQIERL